MILVTGGTGLVGAHLLFKLLDNGKKVRAIYRNKNKLANTKNVFSFYKRDYQELYNKIEWVQADLLNLPELTEAFVGITKVYHCAAFVSFEPDKYHQLRKTNILGTANIVNLCISKNIEKLCYVSSIAALGNSLNGDPIDEETIWNPEIDHNVYALTKYGAEMEVWRGTQEGVDTVIVNPGVILGAGIWKYGTGNLFKKAKKGLKYYASGNISLIDVEDVIKIMMYLMDSNIVNERFVLVAENWTYKQFLGVLAKAVDAKAPNNQVSAFSLNIAWRLDWLKHKLTGKRRQLTKHLAKALQTNTYYSNKKITKAIEDYKFKDIESSINSIGEHYLKQAKLN